MGNRKPFYKVQIDEDNLAESVERMQDSLGIALQPLVANPILDGILLSDIVLDTTATRVAHKLNRKPVGFIVIKRNSSATVYEQSEVRPELFLNLAASSLVTVSLWVF